jgi:hypothetical protein
MVVPDEVRYGEISREMIATGDWVVPRLNGLRYFEKPVMGYWLNGLSMLAFGANAFALRFPSALAAGLSALMIWLLMRRGRPDTGGGIMASLIFLTCFLVVGTGVFSVLDGMLAMFLTMAMTAFYFACASPRGSWTEKGLLALFGILCGMAFLTKGFLAFAVPVVVIVPYLIWAGRWKDLLRMAVIPIAAAVLVSLPWSIAVHLKEPDYWNYFFWQEHVKRFMAEDAQHKAPFWTYFLAFPVAALPWSVLIPASLHGDGPITNPDPAVPFCPVLVRVPLSFLFGRQWKNSDLYPALFSTVRHPDESGVGRLSRWAPLPRGQIRHHDSVNPFYRCDSGFGGHPGHRHRWLHSLYACLESHDCRHQSGRTGFLLVQGVETSSVFQDVDVCGFGYDVFFDRHPMDAS